MCGIAGLFAFPTGRVPQRAELLDMIGALSHRGPDGSSVFIEDQVGLAHARLSIIDLEGGWQPIANEDDSIRVISNGEIFNFIELRAGLERRGHRFRTQSDTEVILHLYEDLGDQFVEALNGQFAIALWDRPRQRLVLARDRTGIRPLFYSHVGGRLAFASEIKALFQLPEVPRRLDADGLASVFHFWSVLPPGSVFEQVHNLPPGHLMVVTPEGMTTRRYWDWTFGDAIPAGRSEADCADELRDLLIDAVRLQLRADVPVGAYLSGGLDSAVITAIIRHHTATPLKTFSLTFEDHAFDESPHQREMARFLGTEHAPVACRHGDIAAAFARTVWHAESPLVRTAPAPMMLLADHVRAAGYRVVLTGEGADEVFAGYDLFKEARIRRFMSRQPASRWRWRLLERLYPYLDTSPGAGGAFTRRFYSDGLDQAGEPWFAHIPRMASTRRALQYLRPDWHAKAVAWNAHAALSARLPDDMAGWSPQGRDQYVEAHTLMSGYLLSAQGDRMAMAASIEARFPFLDHRVIEFANRLPPSFKLRGLVEKHILKQAMADELPAAVLQRPKQPYRAPDSASFFDDGQPLEPVAELLSPRRLNDAGLFDSVAVGKLVDKCRAGRATGFADNMAFVGILSTMLLHEQFIAPPAGPRAPAPA
ncbi:MAG: asparagine synthase (glutamine-hydrolyzing) [Aquabacterium sp.]